MVHNCFFATAQCIMCNYSSESNSACGNLPHLVSFFCHFHSMLNFQLCVFPACIFVFKLNSISVICQIEFNYYSPYAYVKFENTENKPKRRSFSHSWQHFNIDGETKKLFLHFIQNLNLHLGMLAVFLFNRRNKWNNVVENRDWFWKW